MVHRREVLLGGLAAAALPRFALAEIALGGDARLQTVSDGHLVLPIDLVLGGLPEAELRPILDLHGIAGPQLQPPCNVTLYRDADRTVLFDAGSGADFQPTVGRLPDSLAAAGVAPEDVTHVLFTHAHPDHLWGLLDDFGDPAFPEARLLIGRTELEYWTDPATLDAIDPARQAFVVGAQRRLEMVADRIETFEDGDEVLSGIAAVASFGHTPGHMAFEVAGSGGQVMVIGDAIANPHVAFARPGWHTGNDQDPEAAAATRVALLDRLVAEDMPLAGFHLPDGGLGRAEPAEDGYRFVPLDA